MTPVKVGSLREFATVEQAAEKLVSFEKAKESAMQATVNGLAERTSQEGELFYDFDYSLETTRGNKRVLSTVCIRNNKLYIANGQYFCGEACACASCRRCRRRGRHQTAPGHCIKIGPARFTKSTSSILPMFKPLPPPA